MSTPKQRMKVDLAKLRQFGVCLMIVGYFTLVYVDVFTGASIRVLGNMFILPFAIRHKMWDITIMGSMFLTIDLTKALHLLLS